MSTQVLPKTKKAILPRIIPIIEKVAGRGSDLYHFLIALYDETANDEYVSKLFGQKPLTFATAVISKHASLFSEKLFRGPQNMNHTFELKDFKEVMEFCLLMYLDMQHDGTIPEAMTFDDFLGESYNGMKTPVWYFFGTSLLPYVNGRNSRTDFMNKVLEMVNTKVGLNGNKYSSVEQVLKYNIPQLFNISGIDVGLSQITSTFVKPGKNLYLAIDQEDGDRTATLNIAKTARIIDRNVGANKPVKKRVRTIYPFISIANLMDPGKNLLIESAKRNTQLLLNAMPNNQKPNGATAVERIMSRLTYNYVKPKFLIKSPFGVTKVEAYYSTNLLDKNRKRERRGYAIRLTNSIAKKRFQNGLNNESFYRLSADVSKREARAGPSTAKLSKFFGDFLQALSTVHVISSNNDPRREYALTTGDGMLALIFCYMCGKSAGGRIPPKLWLVLSKMSLSTIYGLQDSITVSGANYTEVTESNGAMNTGSNNNNVVQQPTRKRQVNNNNVVQQPARKRQVNNKRLAQLEKNAKALRELKRLRPNLF